MVDGPVVSVRGEVFREVAPEVARFTVTVSARDSDRQKTLARLAERAGAVRTLIDGYGDAIERRESGGLRVYPELKRSREKVAAYHGSVDVWVTVVDFAVLGELMLGLADQEQTSVAGPYWALRPDSPVHRDARREAVADAVQRAREYAAAVGARVTGLLQIADTGLTDHPMPVRAEFATMAMAAGPPQIELDPQPQQVRATVEARFSISEPVLDGVGEPPAS